MKKIIFKSMKFFKHSAIVLIVLLLNVILLLQIATLAGVHWLNGENGQAFVKTHIETALKESGYRVEFEKFAYGFPHRLAIVDVEIYDQDGRFAAIDNLRLGTNIIGLAGGHLGTSLNGDTLTLYRLPKQAENTEGQDTAPFTGLHSFSLPDLYFRSFALNSLRIEQLDIREDVFGLALTLSPTLETQIDLNQNQISLSANLSPAIEKGPPTLPEIVELDAEFDTQSLDFTLDEFTIEHAAYTLTAEGKGNLGENGQMDIALNVRAEDLQKLAGQEGRAKLQAALSGPLLNPALDAKGVLEMPLLKERGLGDVSMSLQSADIKTQTGRFSVETTYKDLPITVASAFGMAEQRLSLTEIEGQAPQAELSGAVDILLDTLKAEGELTLRAEDLSIYAQVFDINLAGAADATIKLTPSGELQGGDIALKAKQLAYDEFTIGAADIEAAFPNFEATWPERVNAKIEQAFISDTLSISSLTTTLSEASAEDTYALQTNIKGRSVVDFQLSGNAELSGLKQAQQSAQDMNFKLTSGGSAINITGRADMQNIDVKASAQKFLLKSLPVALSEEIGNISTTGTVTINGPLAEPVIVADIKTDTFSPYDNTSFTIEADARYEKQSAQMNFTGKGSGIKTLNGQGSVTIVLQLYPFALEMGPDTPLNGSAVFDLQTNELTALFLPPDHAFSGEVNGNIDLAGTIGTPDLSGRLRLNNGQYLYEDLGVQLLDLQMSSTLSPDRIQIESLSARDEDAGRLQGQGSIYFNEKENTRVSLSLKDFHLMDSDSVDGRVTADLAFNGRDGGYVLKGPITLGQFDIIIPERFQTNIPKLNVVDKLAETKDSAAAQSIYLNMVVNANDRIFIRGWGLDAEFGGKLVIEGTANDPIITGSFESRRGRFEEFGRRFTLEKSYLRFQGSSPPAPHLDIRSTTQAEDITANVNIKGTVDNPQLSLSSTPALPEDEILARILFGRALSNITPFQAIRLKQTIDRFSGRGGGFDPLAKLRDLTGFDDIRVDSEGDSNTVGVGKYLTEDVYLELEQGNEEGSGAAKVQVEVTPNINVESKVGQDAETGGGVLWRWDY